MPEFNSQKWFLQLKRLADAYCEFSDKSLVSYNRLLIDTIKNNYPARLQHIKSEIYGSCGSIENKIDHHKIIALYVQLFLENPVFSTNKISSDPYPSVRTVLINEMFCFDAMCIVLEKWHNKKIDLAKFKEYKNHFLKLPYFYRNRQEFHNKKSFFTHALAHIIYFIERDFCV